MKTLTVGGPGAAVRMTAARLGCWRCPESWAPEQGGHWYAWWTGRGWALRYCCPAHASLCGVPGCELVRLVPEGEG